MSWLLGAAIAGKSSNAKVRDLGPFESLVASCGQHKTYACASLTCRYIIPAGLVLGNAPRLQQILEHAVANTVLEHGMPQVALPTPKNSRKKHWQ